MPDIDQDAIAELVRAAIAEALGKPQESSMDAPTVDASQEAARQAEEAANAAAEAERQRWEQMPPEELARHEAEVAIVRYRQGLADALERGGDLDGVEAHGATLAPADVSAVRADVRAAMAAAGNTAAVALIDAGLPSRKKQISDALGRIASGKAKPEDIALVAAALGAA